LPCEFFYAERFENPSIVMIRPLWRAYGFGAATVLLKDGKGRGSAIRDPLLPLKDFGLEILAPLQDLNGKAIAATRG